MVTIKGFRRFQMMSMSFITMPINVEEQHWTLLVGNNGYDDP